MSVQVARFQEKSCPMAQPVCAERVAEHIASFMVQPFTKEQAMEMIEKECGRYVKGKNKGALRGWAHITLCVEGGWKYEGPGERNGFVAYPGKIYGITISDFNGNPYISVGRAR